MSFQFGWAPTTSRRQIRCSDSRPWVLLASRSLNTKRAGEVERFGKHRDFTQCSNRSTNHEDPST